MAISLSLQSRWETEKLISLGLYPTVSLRAARLQRDDARGLLARGIDPSVDQQLKRAARLRTFPRTQ
jgi:Arm DNA-binding domain